MTITINNQNLEITEEQLETIRTALNLNGKRLADVEIGETFKVGKYEFIVLEKPCGGIRAVILKDLLHKNVCFGDSNNYNGSNVDVLCREFFEELENIVGSENIVPHTVDLTAANGMKCYGEIEREVSLLTLKQLQKYAHILSEYSINEWEWLATASGTQKWGNNTGVLCVSPSGFINYYGYFNFSGVRPFCIFKSNILVS